ncbi:MAG: HEAT repeat domain-containing protein [Phycisphaerae bacterium]|nr:HEAT repeat domain-containing protein [Phycisphaerae bacterium]
MNDVVVAMADRICTDDGPVASTRPYWRQLIAMGKKAAPAVAVLSEGLRDPAAASRILQGGHAYFGRLLKNNPSDRAVERLSTVMSAHPDLMNSAAVALGYSGSPKAVDTLIARLKAGSRESPNRLHPVINALGRLGDARAIEPLRALGVSGPVLSALVAIDADAARDTALQALDSTAAAERAAAIDHLRRWDVVPKLPDERRAALMERFFVMTRQEEDPAVIRRLGWLLLEAVREWHLADARRVEKAFRAMRGRVRRAPVTGWVDDWLGKLRKKP